MNIKINHKTMLKRSQILGDDYWEGQFNIAKTIINNESI